MNGRARVGMMIIGALWLGVVGFSRAEEPPVPQGMFKGVRNIGFSIGVNTRFFEYYPAVSPDDKELYFTTTGNVDPARVPNWRGDADIWVATRDSLDEPFGDVQNLQDLAASPEIVINSASGDYSGCISHDLREMYFSSYRDGGASLFVAKRAGPGKPFVSVEKLGNKVNLPDINQGGAKISADGLTLFFHRNVTLAAPRVLSQTDIWIVRREKTEKLFGAEDGPDPHPFEVNSPTYDEFRPSISTDDLFVFFCDFFWVDPRPGGLGQQDIWVTTRSSADAPFGEPVNLNVLWPGSAVNSSSSEIAPALSPDWPRYGSRLYFASNRPGTLGGSSDGDIWEATWIPRPPQAAFTANPESGAAPLDVAVDGSASSAPFGLSIVSYAWDFGDGTTAEGAQCTHRYAEAGEYTIRLTVTDDRDPFIDDTGMSSSASRAILVNCPSGDTSPWQAADIGQPRFPGSAWKEGECISVCAGGRLLAGTSDKLHFVWQEYSGNFVATARIELIDGATSAQIGLMARAGTESNAIMASLGIERSTVASSFGFFCRKAVGGTITMEAGAQAVVPAWVKLQRKGEDLIGYFSTDNLTWQEVGGATLTESPEKLLVGIFGLAREPAGDSQFQALWARACPSSGPDCNTNGVVDAVEISSGSSEDCNENGVPDECDADGNSNGIPDDCEPSGGLQRPGDVNQDGKLDVSDAVWLLGHLFLGAPGQETLPCEGGKASSPGQGDLSLADVNGDERIDLSDPVRILGFLFLGLGPPALGKECVRIVGCPEFCQ